MGGRERGREQELQVYPAGGEVVEEAPEVYQMMVRGWVTG